ncbi:MAG: DUF6165 family protein [Proteobacteria bacterium]|nr:DUF6165 family protein [Pseudomonadota bacterium]
MTVQIDVSYGELLDKISILEIKLERMIDPEKLANVSQELAILTHAWMNSGVDRCAVENERLILQTINETLWAIEDDIREKEAQKLFDQEFIVLARRVYKTNDERARLKRVINEKLGSSLKEEKSYQSY